MQMRTNKIVFYTSLAILIFLVYFVVNTLFQTGSFKSIEAHFEGEVNIINIHPGAEDITIDYEKEIAFISCDDRRSVQNGDNVQGKIYLLNLKDKNPKPVAILDDITEDFHPHGISFFKTAKEKYLLFVVNHRYISKSHAVEIFEYRNNRLYHLESIEDPLINSPNDVVALGEREFYVTNDHGFEGKVWKTMENYLRLKISYINYYDGKICKKVAENIAYANGINITQDKKKVLVASLVGRKIMVYDRNEKDGNLKEADEIFLGTGGDNIEIDPKGNLWIACHPKLLSFVAHSKDSTKKSPSQVLKIKYRGTQDYEIKEVYLNDGTPLSGSSVATVYKDKLLIGSVFEGRILYCQLSKNAY